MLDLQLREFFVFRAAGLLFITGAAGLFWAYFVLAGLSSLPLPLFVNISLFKCYSSFCC